MYLFFDTETTGLPKNWKAPISDLANWPRLVQLAYLYYDNRGNKIAEGDFIIQPDGFEIPTSSSAIHGITTAIALRDGKPLKNVLEEFQQLIQESETLVAHNMSFDEKIMDAEFLRMKLPNLIPTKNKICTRNTTTTFCAIRTQYGYKWPSLSELHIKLFGKDFDNKHNAASDIYATAKCFWELKRIGVL